MRTALVITILFLAGFLNAACSNDNTTSKGQQFSECMDKHSPMECDRIINKRSNAY